jgi:raffinose/stachyose/melibiose transport system substrate-binding protein
MQTQHRTSAEDVHITGGREMNRLRTAAGMLGVAAILAAGPAASQQAPAKPVTVELFALATNLWQGVIDEFQKEYPGITVKWTKFGTDEMKQSLRVAAASGKMPDLWFNWGGSLASPYSRGGHALEIPPQLMKELKLDESVLPVAFRLAEDRGKVFGVPNRVVAMSAVYRKDIFEKHGLKPPASFAELEAANAALKAKGVIPFSLGGKFGWMTMRYTDFFIEHFAGPALHDKLMAMEADWNSDAVVKGFAKLKEWNDKGWFNPGFLNIDPATDMQLVFQSKAAMVIEVPSVDVSRMKRENIDPNGYGTFPLPSDHAPRRVSGFQQQLQISARAAPEVQRAALLFAAYVVRPDVAPRNAGIIGGPSAAKGVLPPQDQPIARQWAEWLQGEVSLYLPTDQALPQEVVAAFFEAQDMVILGTMEPKDAAAQVQTAIEAYRSKAN